ncbi:MAG: hypothetical protein JNL70_23555 [Saprospiraceae bacterium]|nr:hypothetical protein [Saprospiraceae bacterium]
MQHHKLKVSKTAHIYTLGQPTVQGTPFGEGVKYLWFIAHGYGQLASRIIRKFEIFDTTEHLIVAPEALNRFYWKFGTHEVGASWMTRNDRLDEIEDYSQYLTQVFDHYRGQVGEHVKVILFGFSQGCATQVRWLLRGPVRFDALILWGGLLPEDIDYQPYVDVFQGKKIYFVCGDADEFINQERIDWHLDFAQKQNILLEFVAFEGKHEVLSSVLEQVFEGLRT